LLSLIEFSKLREHSCHSYFLIRKSRAADATSSRVTVVRCWAKALRRDKSQALTTSRGDPSVTRNSSSSALAGKGCGLPPPATNPPKGLHFLASPGLKCGKGAG